MIAYRLLTVTTLITFGLLIGCATPTLAPSNVREKSYSLTHKLKKDEAFDRVQAWVAKSSGKNAVRLNDRIAGNIVLQANTDCNAIPLNGGYGKDPAIWYSLDIKVKDKILNINFEDVRARTPNAWDTGFQPANQAEMDKVVIECIDPLKDAIVNNLK